MSWHGLTDEQYEMLKWQNRGRCWLCRKPYSRSRPMAVDHRHRDGLVRGGICAPCNVLLGMLHENTDWLMAAAEYLLHPPALEAIGYHFIPDSPGASRVAFRAQGDLPGSIAPATYATDLDEETR